MAARIPLPACPVPHAYHPSGPRAAGRYPRAACTFQFAARRLALVAALALVACDTRPTVPQLFELLKPEATGITFANTLPEKADFNILNYLYYYNGAGV
ncbi:MAG: hypothetical protein ACJ77J_04010, partial [Gemmatimonadaceae bacterium]